MCVLRVLFRISPPNSPVSGLSISVNFSITYKFLSLMIKKDYLNLQEMLLGWYEEQKSELYSHEIQKAECRSNWGQAL